MLVFNITLIRHGETEYNKKRIIQGQMDTELAEKGVCQAELCGQRLQHEMFTHAYASDLKRAFNTGEHMLKYNRVTKCPLIKDVRLRERNFGEYQDRSCDDFMALLKGSNFKQIQDFAPPKGESLREVRARAVDWFHEVCQQMRDLWETEMAKQSNSNHGNHLQGGGRRHCGSNSVCSSNASNSDGFDGNGAASNDSENPTPDSISSISSGRNSCSLDDSDTITSSTSVSSSPGVTSLAAEGAWIPGVLVVSHGGFLKELIAYFCDELGAVLPGGMKAMTKTPYNTAVSKFSVSLDEDGQARMTCLILNDRDHLLQADVSVVKVDEI